MARKPTRAAAKKKQPAPVQTSESIEEQTRLFLKSGNKIDFIQSGVSGQPTMAVNRQINLGNMQTTGGGHRSMGFGFEGRRTFAAADIRRNCG